MNSMKFQKIRMSKMLNEVVFNVMFVNVMISSVLSN